MATARTALVTGSTDGIGKEIALGLARAGFRVFVHGRNRPKVEHAVGELIAAAAPARDAGGTVEGISFDLGSVASTKKGASELGERLGSDGGLHVLVNNAGIFASERVVTGDGAEATLAVNHVGHYLLTQRLLPWLRRGAPARVIVMTSIANTRGRIHLDDLSLERAFSGYAAYAQSKLANIMHVLDLATTYPPEVLSAYAIHPGVISTKLLRDGFGPVRGASPAQGAEMAIRLATADTVEEPTGTYYSEGVPTPPTASALDLEVRAALRAATERLVAPAASPGGAGRG